MFVILTYKLPLFHYSATCMITPLAANPRIAYEEPTHRRAGYGLILASEEEEKMK